MKIKRVMFLKRDFPLDIISRMEKIASRKIIDKKDKEKSMNIIKKIISKKVIDRKGKRKSMNIKRK